MVEISIDEVSDMYWKRGYLFMIRSVDPAKTFKSLNAHSYHVVPERKIFYAVLKNNRLLDISPF